MRFSPTLLLCIKLNTKQQLGISIVPVIWYIYIKKKTLQQNYMKQNRNEIK